MPAPPSPSSSLTFIIIPDPGYQIYTVTFDGAVISPSGTNTYHVPVSHNAMLLVTIKASGSGSSVYRTVTILSNPHGLINPSGSFQVLDGSLQSVTVQAAPNFLISSVTANSIPVSAEPGSTSTFGTPTTLSSFLISPFWRPSLINLLCRRQLMKAAVMHGDNFYPIDAFGTSRTRGGIGIIAVFLPAGTFGSVLFTELPSDIAPPTSGSYQTEFISVPSYPG